MVQADQEGSSSVTSSPLTTFSMLTLSSPTGGVGSPYAQQQQQQQPQPPSWLRELKSDERGLYLIHLLLNCASHVSSGALDAANACLDHSSLLSSPDGDTMQRISSYFSDALARRLLLLWRPSLYRALSVSPHPASDAALARRHFLDLCPFLRLAALASNQAILESMESERVIHVVDLNLANPAQWLSLMQSLAARPEGPPHLKITGVTSHRELLAHAAAALSEQAERLDIPFQFNPVLLPAGSDLDSLSLDSLRVKTGEALAISCVLQLHTLLACDDVVDPQQRHGRRQQQQRGAGGGGCSNIAQLHRMVQLGQGTLGELLEKDHANIGIGIGINTNSNSNGTNGYTPSPDSGSSSSPFTVPSCARMESFLGALWGLSPKIMVVTEQESDHNGATLNERFMEALNFYAALFDCLESTVNRQSVERARVEKMLFGEEIKNIIACEGPERKERHEKLDKWLVRLEMAGFGRVPLSYHGLLLARRMLQGFGCDTYKVKDENGCFLICWHDRPLFSVSAWRCRRYD